MRSLSGGSGGQVWPQEDLVRRLFFGRPSAKADQTAVSFQAYLAEQLLIVGETAELEITRGAFGAVEMPVSVEHRGAHHIDRGSRLCGPRRVGQEPKNL
jgi:hypothetical protein